MTPPVIFSTGSLYVLDTAQCFALAAEAGFDGIEIMCDERYGTRDPQYLRDLSQQHGLPVRVAHTPFRPNLPGWHARDMVGLIGETLALAEALGCETIVVHLPIKVNYFAFGGNGRRYYLPLPTLSNPLKRWLERELPSVQRSTPVKIALENLPVKKLAGRVVDLAHWNTVEAWSQAHDCLTMDTTHWATHGVDPLEAYRAGRGRICHVHLSNFDGREHRLPHRGHLDLGGLLRTMAADGFNDTICLELHPDALEYQDRAALRRNLRESLLFCRQHLGQPVEA
ncbi:MAG: sugar phosphate isomerase/epimerase [Aggregatilineales bacterium]